MVNSVFARHPFTSILNHRVKTFNPWLVIITAMFFFLILSIYETVSSLYRYYLSDKEKREENRKNLTSIICIFIAWLILTVLLYFYLSYQGTISESPDLNSEHPIASEEVKDVVTAGV